MNGIGEEVVKDVWGVTAMTVNLTTGDLWFAGKLSGTAFDPCKAAGGGCNVLDIVSAKVRFIEGGGLQGRGRWRLQGRGFLSLQALEPLRLAQP